MLRGMSATEFLDWQVYAELEPFGEIRADYRSAALQALIANVNRDVKKGRPYRVEDFLLRFEAAKERDWRDLKRALVLGLKAWAMSEKPAPKRRPRRPAPAPSPNPAVTAAARRRATRTGPK